MNGIEIITLSRTLLGDPSYVGRWNNEQLMTFVDQAQQLLVRDVEFPESRMITTTVPNIQEYPIPQFIKAYRVYMAGQLLVPTTLQVLEGHQVQLYDQGPMGTPQGTAPTQQYAGSGGPPGTVGTYTPQWNVQPPQVFPVANQDLGNPAPDAQSWYVGSRPRYYTRGGFVGIVPAPAGAYTLCVDCLRVPDTVTDPWQELVVPGMFKMAMAWKVCELAKYSDDNDRADAQTNKAIQGYMKEMRTLRTWRKKMYGGDAPRMPKMLANRGFYQKGNRRSSSWWNGGEW